MYRNRNEYIKDESYHDTLIKEHETIVDSIKKKDVELTKQALRSHIYHQEVNVIKKLKLAN